MDGETGFIKHCAALKLGLPALFTRAGIGQMWLERPVISLAISVA